MRSVGKLAGRMLFWNGRESGQLDCRAGQQSASVIDRGKCEAPAPGSARVAEDQKDVNPV